MNAVYVEPPFREYYFIDIDKIKVKALYEIARERPKQIHIYEGDSNHILLKDVFPKVRYEDYCRGLCLLDPYGLHLDWDVIKTAGRMESIEIFLNFPIGDMNRNVLLRDVKKVRVGQKARMSRYWGDESWRDIAYSSNGNLFGFDEKVHNEAIAEAFRKRLQEVAGFSHVPKPVPMRNSKEVVIYYLFFASPKPVAAKIVKDIFDKYRDRSS